MISFDTNIVVHSANTDSPEHPRAREFMFELARSEEVIVCELMLFEVFLKLCNAKIFPQPLSPKAAGAYCQRLRMNRNWRVVESAPVMDKVWKATRHRNFAFRRIIDLRLGLTLRHHGVKRFATTNTKDFRGLGFEEVWNPLK
ncbi:MAG: TA system VapC family ribonuclease toxin [Opitutales bacterium]